MYIEKLRLYLGNTINDVVFWSSMLKPSNFIKVPRTDCYGKGRGRVWRVPLGKGGGRGGGRRGEFVEGSAPQSQLLDACGSMAAEADVAIISKTGITPTSSLSPTSD